MIEASRRNPQAVQKPVVKDPDLVSAYFLVDHPGWTYQGSLMDTPVRVIDYMNLIEQGRSSGKSPA